MDKVKCKHCGKIVQDEDELEIYHRGCRLKAAFPVAYTQKGSLLFFDLKKVTEELEKHGQEKL